MRGQHQEGVGAQIAQLRERHGWSQRELAKAVGLDQSAVSRIEAGRRQVSAAELHRFTDVFGVSADALLGGPVSEPAAGSAWDFSVPSEPSMAFRQAGGHSQGEQELLTAIAQAKALPEDQTLQPLPRHAPPAGRQQSRAFRALPSRSAMRTDAPAPAAAPPDLASPAGASRPRELTLDDVSPQAHGFEARTPLMRPAAPAGAAWAADVAGVVRDWFTLRGHGAAADVTTPWSSGLTAEGKSAYAPRPWQPLIPSPGSADVLYDRVARFWRSELHVEPDDGPVPDLVPLVEDGLGVQVVVARVGGPSPESASRIGVQSGPHPVAAAVVEDGVPFVFVNAGRPVVLQRFALVHALAHLVLGHGDVVDESIGWSRANPREAAANDFAEEFLAPVRAVERWYGRQADRPRSPTLDTLLELANAFGISVWAALFRSRAAGRLQHKQFAALRAEMKRKEWDLLPHQAFLGGLKDTLAHLTPAEVRPPGAFGAPAVLRVPASMRAWCLVALREARLSLEDAAAMLHLEPADLAAQLDRLGLE